jgi:CRISPR system Cascade subunit CasB
MSGFIEWLDDISAGDSRVRAVLRRSLAFEPGAHVPAYPYVEPFVKDERGRWRRNVHYLVAGLWAAHWRTGRTGNEMTLGQACADHQRTSGSRSTESRFIALLDADEDQLPHRLRHMLALLKDQSIDFESVLKGLLYWNDDEKRTQNSWARDFYRSIGVDAPGRPEPLEEVAQ